MGDVEFGASHVTARVRSVIVIVLAQIAGMTLWFSASAIVPGLLASGSIGPTFAAMLTSAVQLGFVVGTLASAFLGLPDRLDPRLVFAGSAVIGAAANGLILLSGFDITALFLRFLTGAALAGVYPVGMKLAVGWTQRHVGLMIGTLVGALTLGSALPHMIASLPSLDWRLTVGASSGAGLVAAALIGLVKLGPYHGARLVFRPADAVAAFRRPAVRLATQGYLGHMWELYAMWAWIGPFMSWVCNTHDVRWEPGLLVFGIMSAGALGCVGAGALADHWGRTVVTIAAMLASGTCALAVGPSVDLGFGAVLIVALIWGTTIIADSGQFSAALAELSDKSLVGTTLTLQTSVGFMLTFVSVQLMGAAVTFLGWRYAFAVLAVGPFCGAWAMWRLRQEPDAIRMADGRR